MIDKDNWQEIFGTIRKNKLRTGLTAAGVFWGIFTLIFMLGIGDGLEKGILDEFGGRSTNSLYIWSEKTTLPYKGMPVGRKIRFEMPDIYALEKQIPFIKALAPRHIVHNVLLTYKTLSDYYIVRGERDCIFQIESIVAEQGRLLNKKDEEERRKVIVIGKTVQKEIFGNENPIGKYVTVRDIQFQVVGVAKFEGDSRELQEADETCFIPLVTTMHLLGNGKNFNFFACLIKEDTYITNVEEKIFQVLKSRHKISPNDPQGFGSFNLEKQFRKLAGLFSGLRWFMWIVGIGTLMAGVVSVSNVMLITVKDRTREIGVRKALGATPWSIIKMILLESVFITTLSGYIGLLFGTGIIAGINYLVSMLDMSNQMFTNPEVNLMVSIGSLVVLIISGLLAGLLPALHAARINPVEALRSD